MKTTSEENKQLIEKCESKARSYCRVWDKTLDSAKGSVMRDTEGKSYIDFFTGAGALNYGHNPDVLKEALIEYLQKDGILHSLDITTSAKVEFLKSFKERILQPRNLEYKVQFTGPTGTNAIESAIKLARKVTGRTNIVCFTNGFHGMTLGSLALTGSSSKRSGAGVPLSHVVRLPFDGYCQSSEGALDTFEQMLSDSSSGMDMPAAVVLETLQAEGGINVASVSWLKRVQDLCQRHQILLIVDEIQTGCGRTGHFFSFERAELNPDIVCLSKSISGYGLPMAIVLIKPEHDIWEPGEHNGTFRGNNAAFVTASKALNHYWSDSVIVDNVISGNRLIKEQLSSLGKQFPDKIVEIRGEGFMMGMEFSNPSDASDVIQESYKLGLIVESAGNEDQVIKIMPALNIDCIVLKKGLNIFRTAVVNMLDEPQATITPLSIDAEDVA